MFACPGKSRYLPAALVVLLLCSMAHADASRYERIVQALQSASPELRARFATSALLELTEVYHAEADLARREAADAEDPRRLRAWSRAVERYAGQLSLVLDDITFGFGVELRRHPREVTSLTVAGRTIMLSHPRKGQQSAYEQSVLAHFCSQGQCRGLVAERASTAAIPMSAGPVSPHWAFTGSAGPRLAGPRLAGPRCIHRNLQLAFPANGNIGRQRARCQRFMAEAELLATELAWQQRHGVSIDWALLAISAVPLRSEHLVALNSAGDSLLLALPLLHGSPGLMPKLTPWLRQRFAAGTPPQVLIEASALAWE